jgi:hypothetical protein
MGVGGIGSILGRVFSGIFGGAPEKAPEPVKENRPDETSEGIANARKQRRALAGRTGRSGLRNQDIGGGDTRSGLTIKT